MVCMNSVCERLYIHNMLHALHKNHTQFDQSDFLTDATLFFDNPVIRMEKIIKVQNCKLSLGLWPL